MSGSTAENHDEFSAGKKLQLQNFRASRFAERSPPRFECENYQHLQPGMYLKKATYQGKLHRSGTILH